MVDVFYISDTAEVRRMAHNVVPANWTDPQIVKYQKRAHSHIRVKTRRFGQPAFDTTEPEYDAAVMCETLYAAKFLLDHSASSPSEITALNNLWEQANQILQGLIDNTGAGPEGTDISKEIEIVNLTDWGRNPEVPVPNKLTRPFVLTGFTDGSVEGKTT